MARVVIYLSLVFLGLANAIPSLSSREYFNLAVPIRIEYNASDGFDGRQETRKSTSTSGSDWIGLFHHGACLDPNNLIDRHKCFIASRSIPRTQMSGEITFEVSESTGRRFRHQIL